MKHTKKETLNALQIIKDECEDTHCELCPFRDKDGDCTLQEDAPAHWPNTKKETEETWRAFE